MITTHSKNWGRVDGFITLKHISDEFSVVVKDGRLMNRWEFMQDVFPEEFEATQEWINAQNAKAHSESGVAA